MVFIPFGSICVVGAVGFSRFAVIVGSILYKGCVAIALSLGLAPTNMKLITAVLFLIILVAGRGRKKVKRHA